MYTYGDGFRVLPIYEWGSRGDLPYSGGMMTFVRSNVLSSRLLAGLSALGLALLLVALPVPAQAHSVLLGTTPEDGEQLATAPEEVTLLFNEDITDLGTEVVVTVDDDEIANEGEVEINGPEISQRLMDARPAGTYTVTWRAVSADGHPISGVYVFTAAEATGMAEDAGPADTPDAEEEAPEEAPETEDTPTEEPEAEDTDGAEDDPAETPQESGGLSSSTWVIIGVVILAVIILATVLTRSLASNKKD